MTDMLKTTPDFSIDDAKRLLAEHYGLDGTLSPLDSETRPELQGDGQHRRDLHSQDRQRRRTIC